MKRSLTLSACLLLLSLPSLAEYNSSLLLKRDIKKSLNKIPGAISKLKEQSKRVSYLKKDEFEKFCTNLFDIDAITATIDNDARRLKNEMTGAHYSSYYKVNDSLKALTNSIHYSLTDARIRCSVSTRMKKEVARRIVKFDKMNTEYKSIQEKYSKAIDLHMKLYQAFGTTNISSLSGEYTGRTPILHGYKKCSVNIKVEEDKINTVIKVRNEVKERLTRDLTDFVSPEDEFKLHDFNFNHDIETSILCSRAKTSKLSIQFKNREVSQVKIGTKREVAANGLGALVQCVRMLESDLKESTCNISQ